MPADVIMPPSGPMRQVIPYSAFWAAVIKQAEQVDFVETPHLQVFLFCSSGWVPCTVWPPLLFAPDLLSPQSAVWLCRFCYAAQLADAVADARR